MTSRRRRLFCQAWRLTHTWRNAGTSHAHLSSLCASRASVPPLSRVTVASLHRADDARAVRAASRFHCRHNARARTRTLSLAHRLRIVHASHGEMRASSCGGHITHAHRASTSSPSAIARRGSKRRVTRLLSSRGVIVTLQASSARWPVARAAHHTKAVNAENNAILLSWLRIKICACGMAACRLTAKRHQASQALKIMHKMRQSWHQQAGAWRQLLTRAPALRGIKTERVLRTTHINNGISGVSQEHLFWVSLGDVFSVWCLRSLVL